MKTLLKGFVPGYGGIPNPHFSAYQQSFLPAMTNSTNLISAFFENNSTSFVGQILCLTPCCIAAPPLRLGHASALCIQVHASDREAYQLCLRAV
jgi:hypothetical protein